MLSFEGSDATVASVKRKRGAVSSGQTEEHKNPTRTRRVTFLLGACAQHLMRDLEQPCGTCVSSSVWVHETRQFGLQAFQKWSKITRAQTGGM